MTLEAAALSLAVEVFEVEVLIEDGHEAQSLVTKLQQYGFLKQENYTWGVDGKNRPRRARASFLVYIHRDKKKSFQTMLTQMNNHMASKIAFRPLTSLL